MSRVSKPSAGSVIATLVALLATATAALASPGVPADDPPLVSALTVADAPLVADAGDTVFVADGDPAVLLGTAFGGTPPYAFSWTTDAGSVQVSTNPTAVIDTRGLLGGTHVASVAVTDAAGATATDTVTFVVDSGGDETVLFEEDGISNLPGVVVVAFFERRNVEVPVDTGRLVATLTYDGADSDFELRMIDPEGTQAGASNPPPGDPAQVTVDDPAPGTWVAEILRWTPMPDPARLVVTGSEAVTDPRPQVDAGGPYAFLPDEPQQLTGTVTGGQDVTVAWDLSLDGVFDAPGTEVTAGLPPGRHLVSFKATTAEGHEARRMTSVLVGTQAELDRLATPVTVIGFADSGINPYHLEFSAATYPDPEVLELTRNFTRHPSEYIPGYPRDAVALPITLGEGYFPDQDAYLWASGAEDRFVQSGRMHWIPGTKIIGAVDAGGFGGSVHPILDDNGHGTGSASVAAGNRYGYCPTCLMVVTDSLSSGLAVLNTLHFVDISSNSWGYTGGAPVGLVNPIPEATRSAAERGQTILFAAGNGVGNTFFDVPQLTYGSDLTGPDWAITVGAVREDSQGAIISDGMPAHVSNLGDGDLPSACRTGDTGQCAFGGTSAATPYTAGVVGHVLTEIRRALGDHSHPGPRDTQVIAQGTPVLGSPFLEDGQLTRRELRAAVLKTAEPRYEGEQPGRFYPLPQQWNLEPAHWAFEGYGTPGPAAAERAIEVLLGLRPMPDRSEADAFFMEDCLNREFLYGRYDRTGDGDPDGCEESEAAAFPGNGERTNDDPRQGWFDAAREAVAQDQVDPEPITYFLHRRPVHAPTAVGQPPGDDPLEDGGPCAESHNEMYMDRHDSPGDVGTCFDDRITSTVAAYRPKGIFAAKDVVGTPLPAGSAVDVTVFFRSQEPSVTELVAVLKATDREVGRSDAVVQPTQPADWTQFQLGLVTDRPVAAGEQLTLHFVHLGARGYAYGYEADHASHLTITPAPQPADGLEFGVIIDTPRPGEAVDGDVVTVSGRVAFPALGTDPQLAGFHPVSHAVQVSVDDPEFRMPRYAAVDPAAGSWTVDLAGLGSDEHTVYVRGLRDRFATSVASVTIGGHVGDRPGRGRPPVEPPRGRPTAPPAPPGPPAGPPGQTGSGSTDITPVAWPLGERAPSALVALLLLGVAAIGLSRTALRTSREP